MSQRKRHSAQPRLEPMEGRVVPSVVGLHAQQKQVAAAHLVQVRYSADQAKAIQLAKKDSTMTARQLAHLRAVATNQQTETAQEQQTSGIAGFFQSIFKNL